MKVVKIQTCFVAWLKQPSRPVAGTVIALALATSTLSAQPILVPGGSFESPTAPMPPFPIHPGIDSWQKTAQPGWYDPAQFGGTPWSMLSGTFPNPIPSAPDHIVNLHGNQAGFLLAVPGVGIFQDRDTMDWDDAAPSHNFDVAFEIGKSYNLTVGVIGSAGLAPGAALRLSLYYRDGANLMTAVGLTDVLYSAAVFPDINHLVDFSVNVPTVQATDAWASQNIGIAIEVMTPGGAGVTYWDVDNVRLVAAVPEPTALGLFGLATAGLAWSRRIRSIQK
jgi:hypothetical protein